MKDTSKEKHCSKVTKVVLFLYDKALAHLALATQKKLAYLGFQCLDHPPYSSDLDVIAAAETWLDGQPSEIFLSGLQKFPKKCIELHREYVE